VDIYHVTIQNPAGVPWNVPMDGFAGLDYLVLDPGRTTILKVERPSGSTFGHDYLPEEIKVLMAFGNILVTIDCVAETRNLKPKLKQEIHYPTSAKDIADLLV